MIKLQASDFMFNFDNLAPEDQNIYLGCGYESNPGVRYNMMKVNFFDSWYAWNLVRRAAQGQSIVNQVKLAIGYYQDNGRSHERYSIY